MKITYKIVLLFTWIVTCILLVMAFILYNITEKTILDDFRTRMRNKAINVAELYDKLNPDTGNVMRSVDISSPTTMSHKAIFIFDKYYRPVYHFEDDSLSFAKPDMDQVMAAKRTGDIFYTSKRKHFYIQYRLTESPYTVVIAAENLTGEEYLASLRKLFLVFLPFALLVTLLAGYIFSKQLIRPIRETINDVNLISTQNLSHRLFVGDSKDELAELNKTFNDLLSRLEESFAIQRRFISNASHELSTPLTSISSQLEVALLQNRNEAEYKRVIGSVLEDVKELHMLTRSLLEIAKAGTHGSIQLDKVRIDEVLMKAHADIIKQNPGYEADLQFINFPEEEENCLVYGNPVLLHSAFKNIIENACKYSTDNKARLTLEFGKDNIIFNCNNKGELPDEREMQFIFEPFYRGSNASDKQGFGLGLTLTQRIIRLHKGDILINSDKEHGTTFSTILPVYR